ncbi:MAG TPA: MaoC/PaaZ C-terminal domain-containing protein [Acidimicrobiales bacterium]|nr:MaoC/PaaZ C-terminal domain-containing protein [Acidimicrobiales bacterium]
MSTQLHSDDRVTGRPTPATPATPACTRLATTVTGAEITDYRNVIRTATGPGPALGPDRWTASPVHPFVLAWKAFDRAVADITSVGSGVVHLSQEIHQERPLRADEPVTLDLEIVGARRDPRGVRLALRSRLAGEDGRVFAELVTGLLALGATAPEPFGSIPPPPAHRPGTGADETVVETQIPTWLPTYYADVSGDRNPIHLDAGAARAAGFPGVIAHGMSVIAVVCEEVIDRYCGGDASRVRGVGGRFSTPVVPGEPLHVSFRTDPTDPTDATVRFGCATPSGLAVKQGWVRIAGDGGR